MRDASLPRDPRAGVEPASPYDRCANPCGAAGDRLRSRSATGVAGGVPADEMGLTCFFAALIVCIVAGCTGVYALCAAAAVGAVMIAWLKRRLGGYTGDGLGAVEQVSEVAALATLAGALS